MKREKSPDRLNVADQWLTVDMLPPLDGHLALDGWKHEEEGACPHSWSSAEQCLLSDDDYTGLDYDTLI